MAGEGSGEEETRAEPIAVVKFIILPLTGRVFCESRLYVVAESERQSARMLVRPSPDNAHQMLGTAGSFSQALHGDR